MRQNATHKISGWDNWVIDTNRWPCRDERPNDWFLMTQNSCTMSGHNLCWIAGWQAEELHWRSVENELSATLFSVSDTHSCHLPLIYALKGLESGCEASNFTCENPLGIHLFVFLSSSWDEHKGGFMSACFNQTDLQDTRGQSHGHVKLGQVEMQKQSGIWFDILGTILQICFPSSCTDFKSWFH